MSISGRSEGKSVQCPLCAFYSSGPAQRCCGSQGLLLKGGTVAWRVRGPAAVVSSSNAVQKARGRCCCFRGLLWFVWGWGLLCCKGTYTVKWVKALSRTTWLSAMCCRFAKELMKISIVLKGYWEKEQENIMQYLSIFYFWTVLSNWLYFWLFFALPYHLFYLICKTST